MRHLISCDRLFDDRGAGNKATRLAALRRAGFDVPDFFVVLPLDQGSDIAALRTEVERALEILCGSDERVAVRSSAAEEDGTGNSHAGQFDSFLDVKRDRVCDRIADVWASARSERVEKYRASLGLHRDAGTPAVIVQKMVHADAAGVAFAADPVSGDRSVAIVAAGHGLGEALVSGACQGDTWRIGSADTIVGKSLEEASRPALSDSQALQVADLVRRASDWFGGPQDIEWALQGRRLFLLQSRDITALPRQEEATFALWDNSNIVESYGGVTTPLTFTVAQRAYREAYRHMGRALGIGRAEIDRNAQAYAQMIGLIRGRVYYNLLNWYRLLMLTPGFRFNRRFMEQMMGVTEGLPEDAVPQREDRAKFARLRAAAGLVRVAVRLATRLLSHRRRVRAFHARIARTLEPVELESRSLEGLIQEFLQLEAAVIPAWETPLLNDLYCMSFHGALRLLCGRWLPDGQESLHADLVSGEAGMISLEPVRQLRHMASIAAATPELASLLRNAPPPVILDSLSTYPEFDHAFRRYLSEFGDRCLDELKLESPTVGDDPLPMLRNVGHMSASMRSANEEFPDLRADAEQNVADALRRSPLKRFVFGLVLSLARARIRDRENLRFERTRVYGRVRAIFVEVGRRMADMGALDAADDIFYLGLDEITGFVAGTGFAGRPAALAHTRREEFDEYRRMDDPPRRFVTCGPPQVEASMQPLAAANAPDDPDRREGQACSPGVVSGRVRIVRDPRDATIAAGDILVAERTDPGWVTIFPLVSGMIMERGSLLSHSAIVAREMGVPAVVGVEDACRWLQDGERVELDGANGVIRKLAQTERAA